MLPSPTQWPSLPLTHFFPPAPICLTPWSLPQLTTFLVITWKELFKVSFEPTTPCNAFDRAPIEECLSWWLTSKIPVNMNWPSFGFTYVFPADCKHQVWITWGTVSKMVFLGWGKDPFCCHIFFFCSSHWTCCWRSGGHWFPFLPDPNTILSAVWRLNTGSKQLGPKDEVQQTVYISLPHRQ